MKLVCVLDVWEIVLRSFAAFDITERFLCFKNNKMTYHVEEIKALATANHAGADILPAPETPAGKPDPAERLKKLESLYQQGLINKDEYEKKKKEIMDSL